MNDVQIRTAARWIYQNKDAPDWWTYLVLTDVNIHSPTPHLSTQEAYRVFQALEENSLIKICGEMKLQSGEIITTYEFNFGKLTEWKEFIKLTWFEKHLPECLFRFLIFWKVLLVASLILIVTSFLQSIMKQLGEDVYKWVSG